MDKEHSKIKSHYTMHRVVELYPCVTVACNNQPPVYLSDPDCCASFYPYKTWGWYLTL